MTKQEIKIQKLKAKVDELKAKVDELEGELEEQSNYVSRVYIDAFVDGYNEAFENKPYPEVIQSWRNSIHYRKMIER